jgi:hypothetical protein
LFAPVEPGPSALSAAESAAEPATGQGDAVEAVSIPPIEDDLDDDLGEELAPLEGVDDVPDATSALPRDTAPEPDSSEGP